MTRLAFLSPSEKSKFDSHSHAIETTGAPVSQRTYAHSVTFYPHNPKIKATGRHPAAQ